MIHKGSLVKMKLGHSGLGIVLAIMEEHPRKLEFPTLQESLSQPHARVFWHDAQDTELIKIAHIMAMV